MLVYLNVIHSSDIYSPDTLSDILRLEYLNIIHSSDIYSPDTLSDKFRLVYLNIIRSSDIYSPDTLCDILRLEYLNIIRSSDIYSVSKYVCTAYCTTGPRLIKSGYSISNEPEFSAHCTHLHALLIILF